MGQSVFIQPCNSVFAYKRKYLGEELIVVNNYYKEEVELNLEENLEDYILLLSNYRDTKVDNNSILRPYESFVIYKSS